jgi:hypothetical protein
MIRHWSENLVGAPRPGPIGSDLPIVRRHQKTQKEPAEDLQLAWCKAIPNCNPPLRSANGDLCCRHLPRRLDWEFQYLAERIQICIPWSNVIVFPKIDTRCADADLFGNFRNRQMTLDPGLTEVASKVTLSSQWSDPFNLRENI